MSILDDFNEDMVDDNDKTEIEVNNREIEIGVKRPFTTNELAELEEWLSYFDEGSYHAYRLSYLEEGKYIYSYNSSYTPLYSLFDPSYYNLFSQEERLDSLPLNVMENILWITGKRKKEDSFTIRPNNQVIEWYRRYGASNGNGVIPVSIHLLFTTNNPILGCYRGLTYLWRSMRFQESIASIFLFNPILHSNSENLPQKMQKYSDFLRGYSKCDKTEWDTKFNEVKDREGVQLCRFDKNLQVFPIEKDDILNIFGEKADSEKKPENHQVYFVNQAFSFCVTDSQTGKEKSIYVKLKYRRDPEGQMYEKTPDLDGYAFLV